MSSSNYSEKELEYIFQDTKKRIIKQERESEIAFLKEYAKEWYDELPPTAHADLLRRIKKLEGEG